MLIMESRAPSMKSTNRVDPREKRAEPSPKIRARRSNKPPFLESSADDDSERFEDIFTWGNHAVPFPACNESDSRNDQQNSRHEESSIESKITAQQRSQKGAGQASRINEKIKQRKDRCQQNLLSGQHKLISYKTAH